MRKKKGVYKTVEKKKKIFPKAISCPAANFDCSKTSKRKATIGQVNGG